MNSVVLYFIGGMAAESIIAILHLWFYRPHLLNAELLVWMMARACIFSFAILFIFLLKRHFDKNDNLHLKEGVALPGPDGNDKTSTVKAH